MSFGRASREVPELIIRSSSSSTNSELLALASEQALSPFTTLVTEDQTAGRGRLGREWVAAPGTSLAISVFVSTTLPDGSAVSTGAMGWLPLAAGVAMADAVSEQVRQAVGVKWPNDVQIDGRKVCGILSELVPGGAGVVIGSGLNVTTSVDELPVPTAISLVLAGADGSELADVTLAAYLRHLRARVTSLWEAGGDADSSGLRAETVKRCSSIGRSVRAELPGGGELSGLAVGIDRFGRLQIRTESGRVEPVAAGDIVHLR